MITKNKNKPKQVFVWQRLLEEEGLMIRLRANIHDHSFRLKVCHSRYAVCSAAVQ